MGRIAIKNTLCNLIVDFILCVFHFSSVSYKRPEHEDLFVKSHLEKEIRALGIDDRLRQSFLAFAKDVGGADEKKFPPRLYHVLNDRAPSAYITSLIVRFFSERRYESFRRTIINEVEYITDDAPTLPLIQFIENHPLFLQITKVRFTTPKWSSEPTELIVSIRSPIRQLDEAEIPEDEDESTVVFNKRLSEFGGWLARQQTLPEVFCLETGTQVPVQHQPTWLNYSDETGFEGESSLAGHVDMWEGVSLLLFSQLGTKSPDVTDGLDHFYSLSDVFAGMPGDPAPKPLSFANYWPRIQKDRLGLVRAFYSFNSQFENPFSESFDAVLKGFSKEHANWVTQAFEDRVKLSDKNAEYTPAIHESLHYSKVICAFDKAIRPIVKRNWKQLSTCLLEILESQRAKAKIHFNRMEKHLKS